MAVDKKTGVIFLVLLITILLAGFTAAGCRPEADDIETGMEDEQEISIQAEGKYVGQIDIQSVEIDVEGNTKAFGLAEGMDVSDIKGGARVSVTYLEQEGRPLLKAIEVIEEPVEEVFQDEGIYVGRIDSRSVEIEVDGEFMVLAIEWEAEVEGLIDGSIIAFTYREGEHRPVLLSAEIIEEPDHEEADKNEIIEGEGVFIGQIDSQSLELSRSRAFALAEGVSVDDIADGAKIAFTYTEGTDRPVLDYIEEVESPPEGAVMPGRFVGQIDSHSVEIEYEQAFSLGEGVGIESIEEGSKVVFKYQEGPARPVLISISSF